MKSISIHRSLLYVSSYIVQLHWKLFSAAMLYKYAFQPRTKIFHPFNEETFQQVHGKLQIWSNLATVYQSNGIGFPFDKNKSWQKVKVGKLETTSYHHIIWTELNCSYQFLVREKKTSFQPTRGTRGSYEIYSAMTHFGRRHILLSFYLPEQCIVVSGKVGLNDIRSWFWNLVWHSAP